MQLSTLVSKIVQISLVTKTYAINSKQSMMTYIAILSTQNQRVMIFQPMWFSALVTLK